jgi:chromate transporter
MLIEPMSSGFTAGVTVADCTIQAYNGANVTEPEKPSLLALFTGWMTIGITSVGGAAGPLRHVVVKQRRWLTETELAELFGIAQALPGATAVNIAVMLSDRFAGPLGPLVALTGLILPSMIIAIVLADLAGNLAAVNVRFASAETGITAAVAGIFISNGVRLVRLIWDSSPDVRIRWRSARLTISALAVLLVAGFHIFVPFAMIITVVVSMAVESQLRVTPV